METTIVPDAHLAHRHLDEQFERELGRNHRGEIPAHLLAQLARYFDAHANDMMVTYYARKLLDKFWRRRSPQRRERMLRVLCASITHKVVLLDFLSRMRWRDAEWMIVRAPGDCSVWEAIARQEGYTRANSIHQYAHLFSEAEVVRAYDAAQAMASPFRERSLAAIYPRVDEAAKDRILAVLLQELAGTSWEAAAQLKCMFHMLDPERRTRVVQAYLTKSGVSERDLAYLIIRNAQHLDRASGLALAERARRFRFNYFKNRCILKLRDHVPAAEIKALFDEFMHDFRAGPAQSELIHNLYHFSAVCPELPASAAIDLALEKIAMLDDSEKERWAAGDKYNELSFLAPLLRDEHQARAFAIAQSVWGGYRNNLLSRLRRHFSQQDNFCEYRYPGLTD